MSIPSIVGKWESVSNEVRPTPWGGHYFLRRFFYNKPDEAVGTLVFYTDDSYTQKNMTVEVRGPYKFLRDSPEVAEATETDFSFTKIKITPHTPEMVAMLNGIPSDYLETWRVDVPQQANQPGQTIMGMEIGVYTEYDLTKVDGDLLYYGARPADGSAPDEPGKRAKALQPPLKRVATFSARL